MRDSYKQLPKELKTHNRQAIWASFKRALYANFIFAKLYKQRHELFALGEIEDNLHLPLNHNYWRVNNTERLDGLNMNPLNYVKCWYGDVGFQEIHNFDYRTATPRQKKEQAKKWWKRNNESNNIARLELKFRNGF